MFRKRVVGLPEGALPTAKTIIPPLLEFALWKSPEVPLFQKRVTMHRMQSHVHYCEACLASLLLSLVPSCWL